MICCSIDHEDFFFLLAHLWEQLLSLINETYNWIMSLLGQAEWFRLQQQIMRIAFLPSSLPEYIPLSNKEPSSEDCPSAASVQSRVHAASMQPRGQWPLTALVIYLFPVFNTQKLHFHPLSSWFLVQLLSTPVSLFSTCFFFYHSPHMKTHPVQR